MIDTNIGIVVPTFNSEKTLDWTLLSLRQQLGCKVKIIVVDSGSQDATLAICRKWDVEEVLYASPGNMYRAVNAGLARLDMEWVSYLNSDDYVFPDAYRRLTDLGRIGEADVVYGNCDYIDFAGRFLFPFQAIIDKFIGSLFRSGLLGFAQPAAIFRRRILDDLNGFNEEYLYSADYDLFCRAYLLDLRFSYLPSPAVAAFRMHSNQFTQTKQVEIQVEKEKIIQSNNLLPSLNDRLILKYWKLQNFKSYLIKYWMK